jgi:hypothetical protein
MQSDPPRVAESATTNAELNQTSETCSRGYRAWLLFVLMLVNLLNLADRQGLAAVVPALKFDALCPGGRALHGADALIANACAAASATGILQAIGVFWVFFLWAALHILLAGKRLSRDLDQAYA